MRIFIIVPVYSNVGLTKRFVDSILCDEINSLIIVDDNPERLHSIFEGRENIDVIYGNGSNYWGGSVNLGLSYIKSKYHPKSLETIILANNDVICNFSWRDVSSMDLDLRNSAYHVQVKDRKGRVIKSCGRLKAWFPFVVHYPREESADYSRVDLLTGRFLITSWRNIDLVDGISVNLPHYGGDSDLGLKLKEIGVDSFIMNKLYCTVDTSQTGVQADIGLSNLYDLLFNIKSSYCIKYKWRFVRNHKSILFSLLIMSSIYFIFLCKLFSTRK